MAVNIALSAGVAATGVLGLNSATSQLVRTSDNKLYVVTASTSLGRLQVYKSVDNGASWSLISNTTAPLTNTNVLSVAIDVNNLIHIAYIYTSIGSSFTRCFYVNYTPATDTFGAGELINSSITGPVSMSIALDTNSIPHISYATGADWNYTNRIAGYWAPNVQILATAHSRIDIQIDQNNIPQIAAANTSASGSLDVAIGNKNNASSFTNTNVDTNITAGGSASLSIDASGNTWIGYQSRNSTLIRLVKHKQTDAWGTWQTPITNGFNGKSASTAADQNDIYIFYERNAGGLAYDRYDTVNSKWLGEQIVQANTPKAGSNLQFHNPFVKWSQYFNNGDTGANNAAQQTIEYLFDDGSTVYYDKLKTTQISTGLATIAFSTGAGATTTSTSSTSSSSTSSSTSVSTSTSSTSRSTSTSSTSSSTSTSVSTTSQSTSTSSTSQSTSVSTSTSSTSSSTSISTSTSSTSSSISTSSTSSSISTSSTSSSVSTSISTSTSSTSSSTSRSTSTSSTSSSISTSSTSSSTSISTSSTSASTSLSTSTSSTSQSTSLSTSTSSTSSSISTSSTSSSISTSSTSASTSLSTSTSISSTSSSTSTTVSITTSTSSTSSSISTSSTSQSTSISTSSTSSSISTSSTSRSTSTSSTSQSTSTSSTSQSTSISTSISSTSQSTSISTSSTSASTSQSTSISSTSQSTSISTSTSSTSQSTSLSTSISSTSSSTSTTISTTTSTSSTSFSTSSTSASTSTTTIAGTAVNMFPRAIIRPFRIWTNVKQPRPIPR